MPSQEREGEKARVACTEGSSLNPAGFHESRAGAQQGEEEPPAQEGSLWCSVLWYVRMVWAKGRTEAVRAGSLQPELPHAQQPGLHQPSKRRQMMALRLW